MGCGTGNQAPVPPPPLAQGPRRLRSPLPLSGHRCAVSICSSLPPLPRVAPPRFPGEQAGRARSQLRQLQPPPASPLLQPEPLKAEAPGAGRGQGSSGLGVGWGCTRTSGAEVRRPDPWLRRRRWVWGSKWLSRVSATVDCHVWAPSPASSYSEVNPTLPGDGRLS